MHAMHIDLRPRQGLRVYTTAQVTPKR